MNAFNPMSVVSMALALRDCGPANSNGLWRCPAHNDSKNSLSIRSGDDGRVLLKCFAGCSVENILSAVSLEMRDLFPQPTHPLPRGRKGRREETGVGTLGLTLEQYAAAKQLPIEKLREYGLEDASYYSPPAVSIPYRDEKGKEIAVRYRIGLTGERFRWKKGNKAHLYGLDRSPAARMTGYVILVEGESDAQTCWIHNLPAFGIPGAGVFKQEWGTAFEGIPLIYVICEPDQGGAMLIGTVSNCDFRSRVRVVRLHGAKDVSELYMQDPAAFKHRLEEELRQAESSLLEPTSEVLPNNEPDPDEIEIARLLGLSALKRERELPGTAKKLGVSVTALKKELKKREKESEDQGALGSPISLNIQEPWADPVDGAELLDEIATQLNTFVSLPRYAAEAIALWIIHTYIFEKFDWSPKLGILSPVKRCGKSVLLACIFYACNRAIDTKGISSAALFRVIAMAHPTICMDEADTISKKNEDMRGLLNGSSQAGAKWIRCVGDDHTPREFSIFTPMAFAMIKDPWETVLDRTLVVRMQRVERDARFQEFRNRTAQPIFEILGRKCSRWAADHFDQLPGEPQAPASLDDRAANIWEPLFAIADVSGGCWPERARQAAVALSGGRDEDDNSIGIRLLRDIRGVFQEEKMSSGDLCESLNAINDSPWSECRRGRSLNPRYLAVLLKDFQIAPKGVRLGHSTPKGYEQSQFEDAFHRYLPPLTAATPQHGTVGDGLGQSGTDRAVADVSQSSFDIRSFRNNEEAHEQPTGDADEQDFDPCCVVADDQQSARGWTEI